MSKNNENNLVPKFRFPEFSKNGEWQLTSIGQVGKFYYGKSAPKWSLSEDAPTPCVRYGELYTKFDTIIDKVYSRTNIEPSNLKFSKGGEILVPRVGEVPQDFAKNCCYLPFPNIAIGEMISVYETKEHPIFYTHYFRTLYRQFAKVVEGQNVKNLYYINLEPIKIGKPSYTEQKKISDCLSSLDEVITAEGQKLEVLKEHKKGLLQNLFPQKGETVPKLRFKEFENSGEWDEKTLGGLVEIRSGFSPSFYNLTNQGKYAFLKVEELNNCEKYQIKSREYSDDTNNIIPKRSVIFPKRGAAILNNKVRINVNEVLMDTNLMAITPNEKVEVEFLYYKILFEGLYKIADTSTIPQINNKHIIPYRILIPPDKNKKEQKKIASALSSLDELIMAQGQKLEALQLHKKGLLQGLFPNLNEVTV